MDGWFVQVCPCQCFSSAGMGTRKIILKKDYGFVAYEGKHRNEYSQ
jgi:hypothetical protein